MYYLTLNKFYTLYTGYGLPLTEDKWNSHVLLLRFVSSRNRMDEGEIFIFEEPSSGHIVEVEEHLLESEVFENKDLLLKFIYQSSRKINKSLSQFLIDKIELSMELNPEVWV